MSRSVVYKCNICQQSINPPDGIGLRFSHPGYHVHDQWDECGSHVCGKCLESFESASQQERLRNALADCMYFLEKGIEVRIGDQWPVLKNMLPEILQKARKALGVLLLLIVFSLGCEARPQLEKSNEQYVTNGPVLSNVEYDGHRFVCTQSSTCDGKIYNLSHHPDCQCQK